MVVIGIVGSPAGGKSTVARRLRELGATWIHADRIVHRCLDKPDVVSQLTARFGPVVVRNDGMVDRRALGKIVFGDDAEAATSLDYLESVIHPVARRFTLRRLARAARLALPAAILDAPLLLEADWGVLCDLVWCVEAPESLRKTWIEARGWNLDELRRRERRQLPIEEKRRLSTQVIINDSDKSTLMQQVDVLWFQFVDQGKPRICDTELEDGRSLKSANKGRCGFVDSTHCINDLSND